jgi:hypothetical protein
MLFLDREPTPEDTQDWDQVLVFLEGSVKYKPIPGQSSISPTSVILFGENNFSQTLEIQSMEPWSISDVSPSIQVAQISESHQIVVTKDPALTELGIHSCSFTVALDGTIQTQKTIQVYVIIGNIGIAGASSVTPKTIILNAENEYTQTLSIESDEDWMIVGVDSTKITIDQRSGSGDAEIAIGTPLTEPGSYPGMFVVLFPGTAGSAVINVNVVIIRRETRVVELLESDGYAQKTTTFTIPQAWAAQGAESSKITVSPSTGSGSTFLTSVTIGRNSLYTPDPPESTTFQIVSENYLIDVTVNFIPNITGVFVDPLGNEEGAPAGNNPVYLTL